MKVRGESVASPILLVSLILSIFGIVAVLSATIGKCASSGDFGYDSLFYFNRQVLFLVAGLCGMVWVRRALDLDRWRSYLAKPLLLVSIFLAVLVLFGPEVNGARRWIELGPIRFQPGELAKLTIILFWADFLSRRRRQLADVNNADLLGAARRKDARDSKNLPPFKHFCRYIYDEFLVHAYNEARILFPAIFLSVVLLGIIELGKDLGTCIVISMTIGLMCYAAGLSIKTITSVFASFAIAAVALIAKEPYRIQRIVSWFDPLADKVDSGYQIYNSFLAIASGGIWGVGVPFSRQKFNFLPEQHCDFIYSIISEELGLVGACGLLLLFFVLCFCGLSLAARCKDPFLALLAFGISVQIIGQAVFNVAVVTGLLPNKGLPLPFISSGGSSLVVSLLEIGFLLNISDHKDQRTEVAKTRRKKRVRQLRSGSTLSSSEEKSIVAVSSGEWEAIISPRRKNRSSEGSGSIPRPIIEPSWSKMVPFQPGSRAERERLRREAGGKH